METETADDDAAADTPSLPPSNSSSSSNALYWPQNQELAQISIPDLLEVVARNALNVIPAERCVVFTYDKATNMLSTQVACPGELAEEDELSFPPVMGMVSACFLQRRCLRAQEPHLHKAFHREYDVPQSLEMNSLIVAPVTLHHRTVGVIQLLNRMDPDTPSSESPDKPTGATGVDGDVELKLLRARTVPQRTKVGFSAKDEQKMIQFTSHVAQLLDNKLKHLAQVESEAKLREERAKTAIELLNMMNNKLEYKGTVVPELPVVVRPRRVSIPVAQLLEIANDDLHVDEEHLLLYDLNDEDADTDADVSPQTEPPLLVDADMMKLLVGISRTQALFRGHHLRKVHKFSEALHQHRVARRRVRSAAVIQRATRRFLARRWRMKRRNAVIIIVRAFRGYKFRSGCHASRTQQQQQRITVVASPPPSSSSPYQACTARPHKVQTVNYERQRFASATRIQRLFRGYRARQEASQKTTLASVARGVRTVVRLQSLVRGSLTRRRVTRLLEVKRAARAANIVCMRIASTDSTLLPDVGVLQRDAQHLPTSRSCVYVFPQAPKLSPYTTGEEQRSPRRVSRSHRQAVDDYSCCMHVESRPLVPTLPASSSRRTSFRLPDVPSPFSRVEIVRQHPSVVFDEDPKKLRRCPPGVQHADDWKSRRKPYRVQVLPPGSTNQNALLPPLVIHATPPSMRSSRTLQVCFLPVARPIVCTQEQPRRPSELRRASSVHRALMTR